MSSKLRHLKNAFLEWAIKWASTDDIGEETPFDSPEVVNVLRAISDVKDKSRKCIPISDDNARDRFWELSPIKPSNNQSDGTILETGRDVIPTLSQDMVHFISGIANQIIKIMMNEKQSTSEIYLNNSFLSSPGKSLSKSFDFPALVITSPGLKPYEPIRYGSLDAIPSTYKASREITRQLSTARAGVVPELLNCSTKDKIQLGELFPLIERAHCDLSKVIDEMKRCNLEVTSCICHSTANETTKSTGTIPKFSRYDKSGTNKDLIERAHCDLSKVIDVMKRCNLENTSCIYNSTANEATASIPTITISESPSQNPGASGTIPKLVSRSKTYVVLRPSKPSQSTLRAASSCPDMIGVCSKIPRPILQESIKNAKVTKNLKTKDTTRSSKHAHIKSTIPKPAPAKKK